MTHTSADHITGYDPSRDAEIKSAVFGKGDQQTRNPSSRIGLNVSTRNQYSDIGFRRTDNDRRPAKVVWRENDGPGDWAQRRAESRKARERLEAKRIKLDRPKTHKELVEERRQALSLEILRMLTERDDGLPLTSLFAIDHIPNYTIENVVNGLVGQDYVERERVAIRGGGSYTNLTITDAGRDHLEEVAL